jgi:hypothetical protein
VLPGSVGCRGIRTDYGELDLCSVSGTILLDGEPLADAIVKFEAPDTTYSIAKTDSSGRYTLMLNSEKRGVIPGLKIVRVSTLGSLRDEDDEGESELGADGADGKSAKSERVPAVYNTESQLKVNVERSRSFDFDLKSDGSTTGPL